MSWTLDAVRVFVTEKGESAQQTIARLQPIDEGTVYHIFGYENNITKLGGYIVGEDDRDSLIEMNRSALPYTLSGAGINQGSFYIRTVSFNQQPVIRQSLRPDLDCTASVYAVEIELFKDE